MSADEWADIVRLVDEFSPAESGSRDVRSSGVGFHARKEEAAVSTGPSSQLFVAGQVGAHQRTWTPGPSEPES